MWVENKVLPSSLWQYCAVCRLLTSDHASDISTDSYPSLRSCGLYSAVFRFHFSFVLCFIWKQLKSISSAITKGEKTEMFYIGGNTDIISFLLCIGL